MRATWETVPVEPSAGAPVLRWLVDRFTHTGPSSWRTTSLQWELAMSQDVRGTARAAGISETLLRERPACGDGALDELSRRVREHRAGSEPRGAELNSHEVLEDLVVAIRGGHHLQAAALAESMLGAHPEDPALIQASAFCRTPTDPDEAWRRLQVVVPGSVRGNPFVLASLACVHLAKAEPVSARRLLGSISEIGCDPQARGWLWDPWDLLGRVQAPVLHETTLCAWVTGALHAIDILCPSAAGQVTG